MFDAKKLLTFLVILLSIQISIIHSSNKLSTGLKIGSFLVAGGIYWSIYNYSSIIHEAIKAKIIDKIETEIADDVVLLNTPNSTIRSFAPGEREKKFKKKAWLLERKTRIIEKLEAAIHSTTNGLSNEHRENIKEIIHKLNLYLETLNVQKLLPMFSQDNPYYDCYKKPTLIDELLENKLVSLLIACAVPEVELTEEERMQKGKSSLSGKRIIAKMAIDVGDIAYKKFEGLKFKFLH